MKRAYSAWLQFRLPFDMSSTHQHYVTENGEKSMTKTFGALLHRRGNGLDKGAPLTLPISQNSTFHLPGEPEPDLPYYGRVENSTWDGVEKLLNDLEQAPTLIFPSGMAAIAAALFSCVKSGDRVLIPSDGYYVTRRLCQQFLSNLGVDIVERSTKGFLEGGFENFAVVFVETPSNPGLELIDLSVVTKAVRAAGGVTIADNTTMTPLGQRPLDFGIDIVVSADTKAPGGHSDLLMGHLSSRNSTIMDKVAMWRKFSGSIPGPHDAWLLYRGLETLELRFDRMCTSAEIIAPRLASHRAVKACRYPGMSDDPAHLLAKNQMTRFGFLMSLTLYSETHAELFINECSLLRPATSFGGVHSAAERRARWGDAVDPAFVRVSVGCEPTEELWAALEESLDRLL